MARRKREGIGGHQRKRLIRRLAESQNWRCCYCHRTMVLGDQDGGKSNSASLERVLPGAFGGRYSFFNCVAACRDCNSMGEDQQLIEAALIEILAHYGERYGRVDRQRQTELVLKAIRQGLLDVSRWIYIEEQKEGLSYAIV